jgi:type IV fimbrial biogenesis protein FimT
MAIRRTVLRTASHSGHPESPPSVSSKFAPLSLPSMSGMLIKNRLSGFTLTELVVVMAIVGILTAIGVPSFRYVTTSNRVAAEVNALLGDMRFARTEAVRQGQTVTVCASSNGTSCSGSAQWKDGWIVFSDINGDHVVNGNDAVLRWQKSFATEFGGTDTFLASPTLAYVVFNREGFGPTGQASTVNVTLHDPTSTAAWTRCVAITVLGMVSTEASGQGTPTCT